MQPDVTIITTPFILNISVNCYLVKIDDGFILIDTALARQRSAVEQAVERAGCVPGNLKLIVLTHGDFDHCGSAAYLSKKFSAKVAMHYDDKGMVEDGDMFWNRKQPNVLVKALVGLLLRLRQSDRFTPDVYLAEGNRLDEYGLDAEVIELPGHSKGNIGILTARGDLFCGDLLANTRQPAVWTIVDDQAATQASVQKLYGLGINYVYPGHGKPFPMAQFINQKQEKTVTEAL